MRSKRILFDNDRYEVGLGMGQWAKSVESKPVDLGSVRVVGGVLMYAYSQHKFGFGFGSWEISWVPVDDKANTPNGMRVWVASLRVGFEKGVATGRIVGSNPEREKLRENVIAAAGELTTKIRNISLPPSSVYELDSKLCSAVDALAAYERGGGA